MSGFLFLLVIDWVMRKTLREGNTGIRWKFTKKLEDLDFAGDLALLSSTRRQLQLKNERLSNASKGTGLKINITETKVTRFNAASEEKLTVNGEELEDVYSFVHLGAKVSTAGGADDDINSRLCKVSASNCLLLDVMFPPSRVARVRESRSGFRQERDNEYFKQQTYSQISEKCLLLVTFHSPDTIVCHSRQLFSIIDP